MEADRNFYEFTDETLEERDGTYIQQRTRDIEEENENSPVSYSGPGGGFSIYEFHTNRLNRQDESDELSEDSEDETVAGTSYEGDVTMEDIESPQVVRWCYCDNESDMTAHPKPTHTFTTTYVNKERPEGQHEVVYVFNQNCAIMEDYVRRYFVDNSVEQNNRSLITALEQLLDPILYSVDLAVARVTSKIEWVVSWRNEARTFVKDVGLPDYNNRHCRRLNGMAMKDEENAHDMMVHNGATLYQVAMELLIMARFNEDDDVQERYREIKDKHRLTYPADPWKNIQEEYIEPSAKDRVIMLKKIDTDLIEPAQDMLYDVKEDLNHALLMVWEFAPISTRYRKLEEKRKEFSNGCLNAAALLEISAMYLIYMASGRDEATLGSSVDVFGGRNQFLKVIGASECHLCGNEFIEEEELLI